MLTNIKNDLMYLLNILESIEKIELYSKDFNDAEKFYLFADQLNFNATLNLFANIGENIGKLSEELKSKNQSIPWRIIKDFRNKVVHNYVNLDIFMIFDIIKNNLPSLKGPIEDIIIFEISTKNFNFEELVASKDSIYYKHINFSKLIKE
ncbi:MAG: HepT-like ribonuclease domain-containing protein [Cetobacterium sp.]